MAQDGLGWGAQEGEMSLGTFMQIFRRVEEVDLVN